MHDRRQDIVNLLRSPEFPTLALILKEQDELDFGFMRNPDCDPTLIHMRIRMREDLRDAIRSLAAEAGYQERDPFDV